MSTENKSLLLGSLGVLVFALTLPMTRLATGSALEPALSPWFVSFGRAALAGLLSIIYLVAVQAPRPRRKDYLPIALAAIGNVLGWPIFFGFGLALCRVCTCLGYNWHSSTSNSYHGCFNLSP